MMKESTVAHKGLSIQLYSGVHPSRFTASFVGAYATTLTAFQVPQSHVHLYTLSSCDLILLTVKSANLIFVFVSGIGMKH
jgi:hypothetical protein